MKLIITAIALSFSVATSASIEYAPNENSKASDSEIQTNRACFKELEVQGCGSPGDDQTHFRSCLNDVHHSLTSGCKTMMTELYGVK